MEIPNAEELQALYQWAKGLNLLETKGGLKTTLETVCPGWIGLIDVLDNPDFFNWAKNNVTIQNQLEQLVIRLEMALRSTPMQCE